MVLLMLQVLGYWVMLRIWLKFRKMRLVLLFIICLLQLRWFLLVRFVVICLDYFKVILQKYQVYLVEYFVKLIYFNVVLCNGILLLSKKYIKIIFNILKLNSIMYLILSFMILDRVWKIFYLQYVIRCIKILFNME